jgi:hypothetical protein
MNPLKKSIKALQFLGLRKIWLYALYKTGLQTGHYRRVTPSQHDSYHGAPTLAPFSTFPNISQAQKQRVLDRADEILQGRYRPFHGETAELNLRAGASNQHWSILENDPPKEDIKMIWEPGRFGWAINLARAYAFSDNPAYTRDFWQKTLTFLDAHPPNLGRQWQSGQEVAIRLMALIFCDRVFTVGEALDGKARRVLWRAIAEHAKRIPPTLVYAQAQDNNHLLTEAAGLCAAGTYLGGHPQAKKWQKLGLRWLNWGFQNQIDEFGTYTQHSTNYHRLMLQVAIYADHFLRLTGAPTWPVASQAKLAAATRWLWALTDPKTGRTPNLGANDGAYLFPLTVQDDNDFRPVVDTAAKAFLGKDVYQQPGLSEMAQWFKLDAPAPEHVRQPQAPDMLRLESENGRAFIHTAHYNNRPSHADQLHVDLWWRGVNITLDPGTYQYNAPPPWDNALVSTHVHNTLTIDGQEQMTGAGRFLWLDWAQAQILAHEVDADGQITRVTAEHDGYRQLGALHQRTLLRKPNGWQILDSVIPYGKPNDQTHTVSLAWLMPDWAWTISEEHTLLVSGPRITFKLHLDGVNQIHLVRAGECLHGAINPEVTWGWQSCQYGEKSPILILIAHQSGRLPIKISSTWEMVE